MRFVIQGRLDGLNEYTRACRGNAFGGNAAKKRNQKIVKEAIQQAVREGRLEPVMVYPIELRIIWFEKNQRRDIDNIVFAKKFIQDALVEEGILEDDSQKYINQCHDLVLIDKENPRIEVELNDRNRVHEEREDEVWDAYIRSMQTMPQSMANELQ